MKINCVVIEDEPLAAERMRNYISRVPYLNLVASFENGMDAFVFLKSNQADLLFLDINLGEFSGIELLESIATTANVIITTAYNEFALKGYELNVKDYLMKPITFDRFLQAVNKVEQAIESGKEKASKEFVFIKTENRLEKILLNDILFIEGMRDYRRIHTSTKKIMTLQTFKDLEVEIPASIVCRVHKSYMVSLNKIDFVERDEIKIHNMLIPISDTYKKRFYELISGANA